MVDIVLGVHWHKFGLGFDVTVPHESVVAMRFTVACFSLHIVFGARIKGDDE